MDAESIAKAMTRMGWKVNEEVNRDRIYYVDEMNLEVDSKDEVTNIQMSEMCFSMKRWLVGEKGWQQMRSA